jgi:hypothetical protein
MKKYASIIEMINTGIGDFNKFLNAANHLPLIDNERLENKMASWRLKEEAWFDRPFPNGDSKGIYFVFGFNPQTDNELSVYVGKASHQNSMIGARLDSHLNNPRRDEKIYQMRHKDGIDYEVDFVTTIPLDEMPFISSAVEEFLIYFLKKNGIVLLNHIGNK